MPACRQMLMWSVPPLAFVLGFFWLRRKRDFAKSDPGGNNLRNLQAELAEVLKAEIENSKAKCIPLPSEPEKSIIKSAPIDIVPNGSLSQRTSPRNMTEQEVDIEIDKIIRQKSYEKERKSSMLSCNGSFDARIEKLYVSDTSTTPVLTKLPEKAIETSSEETPLEEKEAESDDNTQVVVTEDKVEEEKLAEDENIDENVNNEGDLQNYDDIGLDDKDVPVQCEQEEQEEHIRHSSERDSANHSPLDPILASPSMCHYSDNHSEGSSDSGKGCSEAASPPPAGLPSPQTGLRLYQFIIPQSLVGLLIGKHGAFVSQVKSKTSANIFVKRHPDSVKLKICAIEGTQGDIDAALDMIRRKFPEKRFPQLSLQEISTELCQRMVPLVPEYLQLQLVEVVNNDTIVSCLVTAGHIFLQQPTHPTFPSLHVLHRLMGCCYQSPEVPALPEPVTEGTICVAPTENNWYRAQILAVDDETSVVKLVDFGGYLNVDNSQLKQIRSDFMTLPFQAIEAILALIKPANGTDWSNEALRVMAGLTAGQLLQAQVVGYDEGGIPLVNLYLTIGVEQVVYLNQELVERGLAEWDVVNEPAKAS